MKEQQTKTAARAVVPERGELWPVPAWLIETLAELGVAVTHRDGDRLAVGYTMGPEEALAAALAAMEASPTPENVRRFSNAAIRAGLPCGDELDPAAGWRAFADEHDPMTPIHKMNEGVK